MQLCPTVQLSHVSYLQRLKDMFKNMQDPTAFYEGSLTNLTI